MKKNKKHLFMVLLINLIVTSDFCMDRSRSLSLSTSSEDEFDQPFILGLPNPAKAKNRTKIIQMLTMHSSLEDALEFINNIGTDSNFKIFLNNPQNLLTIVHILSNRFQIMDKGDYFDLSDMEVCDNLTVERASIQISLQNNLNDICKGKILDSDKSLFSSLIKQGVDVNFSTNLKNEIVTPLILAIMNNNTKMVRLLLKENADPNKGMYEGNTPLIMCILKNDVQLVKILLEAGANINLPNKKEVYPLGIAKEIDNKEIINLIRESVKTRK